MLGKKAIDLLRPLLEGNEPAANGEWSMHCPYHGDSKRSASINVNTEEWFCHGCNASGEARLLIKDRANWDLQDYQHETKSSGKPKEIITEATVDGWAAALLSNKPALEALKNKRGLTTQTIKRYEIGWDGRVYTLPIRDMAGVIVNVRRYDINVGPDSERRKIWSVEGMGTPTLYPVDQLERDTILVCEGEFDALVAIQNGIPAITRTGTADHWKAEWSQLFRGKRVYVCHDMDEKGQHGNDRVVASLRGKTISTTVVKLPYAVGEKHGEDISDFFVRDGHSKEDFIQLTREGKKFESLAVTAQPESPTLVPVSVMDSFDGRLVERPLAMQVTVTGKRIPSYLVPARLGFGCDLGNGPKCKFCSLNQTAGQMVQGIGPESPLILSMIEVTDDQLRKAMLKQFGVVPNCPRVEMDILEHRTVEEIYVRPSIEMQAGGLTQDFTNRKVISAASHDLGSNQTVDIFGTIRPNPKKQTNEFQAWRVEKPDNTLDSFQLTDEIREQLDVLRDEEDPLGKMYDIANDVSEHVTKIYHRGDMHVFMDLVIHSGLEFRLGNESKSKGWLDALIIGDTRTGKSEAAAMLLSEYSMGEMISCESATYAGVVGGLDRTGDGQWIVKWGSIPVNDRRVVALDEVSGLQPEQIAQMSSIRSSGVAEMTKIQNERAMARTRLLWLANPREARMDDFTFGVQAIQPLVGNPEDIARYDMAMGVFSRDVASDLINASHRTSNPRQYDQETLQACIRWAWTRNVDDISISAQAVKKCLDLARSLGDDFTEVPPLIQAANIRLKLARIAIAVAMRTFSCDERGRCVVKPVHMEAADQFLRHIYGNPDFGYGVLSAEKAKDLEETEQNLDSIMNYIVSRPGLLRFLRTTPSFDRNTIETVMNIPREVSGTMINSLWDMKAVTYEEGKVKLAPQVLALVRGMGS